VKKENFNIELPYPNHGLDRFERIEAIDYVSGFLPVSKPEQVEALSLQNFPEKVGGAAKHLAEVVLRQKSQKVDDPLRAAKKLTRNYIDYALDAQNSADKLGRFAEVLDEVMNPELRLSVVLENDIRQPGLIPYKRFVDLSKLKNEGSYSKMDYDPQKVKYTPENGGLDYYLMVDTEEWRVGGVKRVLPEAQASESNRQAFWMSKLVEVAKGYPKLRPIASEGLDKLHAKDKLQ